MFKILLVPFGSSANAIFFYSTRESAEIAHKNILDMQKGSIDAPVAVIKDDAGHVMTISKGNICYAMFIDEKNAKTFISVNTPIKEYYPNKVSDIQV